jgi:SAM-dependent methyltransferase
MQKQWSRVDTIIVKNDGPRERNEGAPMNAKAMEPFGRALLAYLGGDSSANLIVRRDDGKEASVPVSLFFRGESAFTELEKTAMDLCVGRVLDIGAGAGLHSLALQQRGHLVTAIDISPEAVAVASRGGVADARCADIFAFEGGPYDTLLMLGHGIGMVETIEGLRRFLARARSLVTAGGQLLVDSLDVRVTADPRDIAYHEANRNAGRYIGEIRMRFEFKGGKGPYCSWLHVDAGTLREHSESAGWLYEVAHQGEHGDYLARLSRHKIA